VEFLPDEGHAVIGELGCRQRRAAFRANSDRWKFPIHSVASSAAPVIAKSGYRLLCSLSIGGLAICVVLPSDNSAAPISSCVG
jgi:hypothetical protein